MILKRKLNNIKRLEGPPAWTRLLVSFQWKVSPFLVCVVWWWWWWPIRIVNVFPRHRPALLLGGTGKAGATAGLRPVHTFSGGISEICQIGGSRERVTAIAHIWVWCVYLKYTRMEVEALEAAKTLWVGYNQWTYLNKKEQSDNGLRCSASLDI